MEDLCSAFDAIISPDNEIRASADSFLDQQIKENPDLFPVLFDIYNNSTSNIHKKLSLIVLKLAVCYNFDVVRGKLEDFSQLLGNSIVGSEDQSFYKYQVEIVLQIAFRLREVWNDFPTYLTLFQENDNLIPFCVYLFFRCSAENSILQMYNNVFKELSHDIILRGLQFPDIDIQLCSIKFFLKFISKHNNTIPEQYEEHYNYIQEIAKNTADLSEDKFNIFWSQLYRLHLKYLGPFFDIAKGILDEGKELSPNSQLKLFNILILCYTKLVPEDLEYIINTYFNLQSIAEGIDFNEKIFENLSKVDFKNSYTYLRDNLHAFITNDDQDIQYKGLSMLDGFIKVYMNQIKEDISVFLNDAIAIAANSFDNFNLMTKFILSYLQFNKFNYEDTQKIYDMIFKCFVNDINVDFRYLACQISVHMGPNPCLFDNFLEIFERIPIESLSVYFSLLLNLHSVENNMSDQKYEIFYEFLIEKFIFSSEKVDEVYQSFLQDKENEEIFEELYNYALLRNSSSNLIYLFSVYNPARFAEFFEKTIECFVDLIKKEELREGNGAIFSIVEIENDFTRVFKTDIERSIEVLKNFYEEISEGQDIEDLQHFLISLDNSEYDNKEEFIEYYQEFRDEIAFPKKLDKENIINDLYVIIKPVCKWIYKLNEEEIQLFNQPTSTYEENYIKYKKPIPPIHGVILNLLKLTRSSYELLIILIDIIKTIVNPKRLNYNQENAWYNDICQKLVFNIQSFVTKALPQMDTCASSSSFKALSDLMKVFIYTNCEFGHEFLMNFILPFYNEYQESSEIGLLDLFSKMIDSNYFNQTEIDVMAKVIDDIMKREKSFYLDSRPSLILLITKLSKLNNEFAPVFIEFILQTFDSVKEDPFLLDVKISCSYFLLSSFNQDNEQFKIVFTLLPDIFSVFPCRKLINELFAEMKTFIENNAENLNKDLYESLISALMRYLSYQNNASNIFNFNQDFAECLVQIFGKLLETYCTNCQIENPEKLINDILSDKPIAAQYILSLNNQ